MLQSLPVKSVTKLHENAELIVDWKPLIKSFIVCLIAEKYETKDCSFEVLFVGLNHDIISLFAWHQGQVYQKEFKFTINLSFHHIHNFPVHTISIISRRVIINERFSPYIEDIIIMNKIRIDIIYIVCVNVHCTCYWKK